MHQAGKLQETTKWVSKKNILLLWSCACSGCISVRNFPKWSNNTSDPLAQCPRFSAK
jgi:hypothetical protein